MATTNNRLVMTPEEVRQSISSAQTTQPMATPQPGQTTNPGGYQPIAPVTTTPSVPQSSAWRNVQQTGNAKTDYTGILNAQPGAYQSAYQPQIGQTVNNLLQQRPFAYDVNTDVLYQQLKDNYIRQGRQAMMDTQGASAALTGGYGNSYGVQAGQQAYQNSLGALSAQIPELYNLAYQRYLGGENSQRQNLAALQGLDESEYQRYQYDTQQYEAKLADAYQKYKAATSGGGSGKKKDPRSDAEWFYNYSVENGWEPDVAINAVAGQAGWTKEYTEAVRSITHGITDYKKNQEASNNNQNLLNNILNWATGK